jgi:hypothetical protein
VNPRSPNHQLPPTQSDELERRSWLISLVYDVLRDMKTPTEETTSMAVCSDLSRAFLAKARDLENLEVVAATVRGPKLPRNMYSANR